MKDVEFCNAMRSIGFGDRSFAVLRGMSGQRPLAASEQIADQISYDIAREILPPLTPLREQALAERFGVSRGPVRDALRLLERDALVRVSPNRGAVVTGYSAAEMRQIADISRAITYLTLSKVTQRASDLAIVEMTAAQLRTGRLLHNEDPVAFALAVAAITMTQARFATGRHGEMILQLLYRPSIRYTVAGLRRTGAADQAETMWDRHIVAMQRRDPETASKTFLHMLRDIHLPVIVQDERHNSAEPR
ncbi:GntR family transcriptional regulator [Sphingomonas sp. RB3P16]|uniref:GntR family transcriptional regulator n=1 Tax=Parasphingomonas frigoris TaxID=3096163 RepID=UPI002FC8EB5E